MVDCMFDYVHKFLFFFHIQLRNNVQSDKSEDIICVFLSRTKSSMGAEKNLRKTEKKGQMYDEEEKTDLMEVLGRGFGGEGGLG